MKRVVSIAASALALASVVVTAQPGGAGKAAQTPTTAPQRHWFSVTITTIKADRVADWIAMQQAETIPMQQKGGIAFRDTWQSGAPFGEGNMFAIVTPIDKFATYDMPNLARRILGDGAAAYQRKLADMTESRRTL